MVVLFFFNDTATTEIYTLSLHDALPISATRREEYMRSTSVGRASRGAARPASSRASHLDSAESGSHWRDRKSTRLNSSHGYISYAVFCLKKKKRRIGPVTEDVLVHHRST